MLESILIPFFTILAAEFLDKSQLSILILATKTKRHLILLLGVFLAFVIVDGAAILFGGVLTTLIPKMVLKIVSGCLFLLFGFLSLKKSHEDAAKPKDITRPFLSGFLLVFLSEWGDKTQIASAVFATQYNPWAVATGVLTALFFLSAMAITVSKLLTKHLELAVVHKVSSVLFILLGLAFLLF